MTSAPFNFDEVFSVLEKEEDGFEFDDAWDTYKQLSVANRDCIPCLLCALKRPNDAVRLYALKALNRIGGDLSFGMEDVFVCLNGFPVSPKWVGRVFSESIESEVIKLIIQAGKYNPKQSCVYLDYITKSRKVSLWTKVRARFGIMRMKSESLKA